MDDVSADQFGDGWKPGLTWSGTVRYRDRAGYNGALDRECLISSIEGNKASKQESRMACRQGVGAANDEGLFDSD